MPLGLSKMPVPMAATFELWPSCMCAMRMRYIIGLRPALLWPRPSLFACLCVFVVFPRYFHGVTFETVCYCHSSLEAFDRNELKHAFFLFGHKPTNEPKRFMCRTTVGYMYFYRENQRTRQSIPLSTTTATTAPLSLPSPKKI